MTRGQRLFVVLTGFFTAFLFLAEMTGGKLFRIDMAGTAVERWLGIEAFTMTLGVIAFAPTFVITDLMNEYFGRRGVRFATFLAMAALVVAYGVILVDVRIPAWERSPVGDEAFRSVFLTSGAIIVASIVAFLIGQLIDLQVFHMLRRRTGNRHIWLRATGSTIVSQLVDSFVVIWLAFGWLTSKPLRPDELFAISATNFTFKLLVAIAVTPVIYAAHAWIDRFLGNEGETLRARALADEAFVITPFAG